MISTSFESVVGCWCCVDKSDIVSEAVVPLIVTSNESVPEPPCWKSQLIECVRSPSTLAKSSTALSGITADR